MKFKVWFQTNASDLDSPSLSHLLLRQKLSLQDTTKIDGLNERVFDISEKKLNSKRRNSEPFNMRPRNREGEYPQHIDRRKWFKGRFTSFGSSWFICSTTRSIQSLFVGCLARKASSSFWTAGKSVIYGECSKESETWNMRLWPGHFDITTRNSYYERSMAA